MPERNRQQDPAEADPRHYRVEFENDRVRVLRIRYEVGAVAPMHTHPDGVVVFLTDAVGRFRTPDGPTQEASWKAGQVGWAPATAHQPENIGPRPFEILQIELKG